MLAKLLSYYWSIPCTRAHTWTCLCYIYPGQEIMSYKSPSPVLGIHRIVFVLFQQLGQQTVYAPGWQQNFNTRDFAELYNLGSPVAAVYFNCQRESGTGGRRMQAWITRSINKEDKGFHLHINEGIAFLNGKIWGESLGN